MTEVVIEEHESYVQVTFEGGIADSVSWDKAYNHLNSIYPNLIIQLINLKGVRKEFINSLEAAMEIVLSEGKSFIFVCKDSLITSLLDEDWTIVPTKQEALDYLKMEEIEREMGLR